MPEILNAVTIKGKSGDIDIDLVVEVMQHLGDNVTRCIAMSSTDGLTRGMEAEDTGAPIRVPVGKQLLVVYLTYLEKQLTMMILL